MTKKEIAKKLKEAGIKFDISKRKAELLKKYNEVASKTHVEINENKPKTEDNIFIELNTFIRNYCRKIGIKKVKQLINRYLQKTKDRNYNKEIAINFHQDWQKLPLKLVARQSDINKFIIEFDKFYICINKLYGYKTIIKFLK